MVFSAAAILIPVRTSAAHSPSVNTESTYTKEQIKEIVTTSYGYTFNNAAEMLDYELSEGYLDYVHSAGNRYSIYVNRYTGVLYYKNNTTGEILTSNPYNPGTETNAITVQRALMSQVDISFIVTANSADNPTYNSSQWAAEYAQIAVTAIKGGLRVNYTMGDTATRFLIPGQISGERFENDILKPMLKHYELMLEEYCRADNPDAVFDLFASDEYDGTPVYKNEYINSKAISSYLSDMSDYYSRLDDKNIRDSLKTVSRNIEDFYGSYRLINPIGANSVNLEEYYNIAPLTKEGVAVYAYKSMSVIKNQRTHSAILRLYCPEYTFNDMYAAEEECSYVYDAKNKPSFRLALEYTFNDDGSLNVRLPANSIIFDETLYTFKTITPLPYFGSGNISDDGYIFVPDGSGSVIEYEDFSALTLSLSVYGTDYCYSKISGKHREQVTMPVYGMVSTYPTSPAMQALTGCGETAKTGYFAILEEGASLANLMVSIKGTDHDYAATYAQFTPYPSDEYDLSTTISVGAKGSYTMVSESKYTGSYVTRYVMLSNFDASASNPDYNGMAEYYRQYLIDNGTISALENVHEDLPLYIEALGSMEKIEKFLSFPITVDVPLTTFEDVIEMYNLLSDARAEFIKEAERYEALAAAEEDDISLREQYEGRANEYRRLADEVKNITNVNFKLTGFANDGMYYTYPVRVKWERCLGGKKGVREMLIEADRLNEIEGNRLGIYPEFDFQYMNNTSLFDGIGKRNNISRMVDNRYASKQLYNTVTGEFESFFSMIISPDALERLYGKFYKKYSKYDFDGLSVSTLGSDLNSNFDDDNPINRDQSQSYVTEMLDTMASEYSLMINKGNIYAVEYADHIVDISIDSSHFTYSSYNVPFTGLVLHGFVNYAGGEMNYSGTPAYELLHSIENGASLYYTLAMQNTELMKDDEVLNKYFGVDFKNWYHTLVQQYTELDNAIGDLQSYQITEHKTLVAERVLTAEQEKANTVLLIDEFVKMVEDQIVAAVSDAFDSLYGDPANYGKGVKLTVDTAALVNQLSVILNLDLDELTATDVDERIAAIAAEYTARYAGTADSVRVDFTAVDYVSGYDYVTDSFATDENYDYTEFTVDNHLVTMVKYVDVATGDEVVFILNYNIYAVEVVLDANTRITLGEYGYVRID